MLNKPPRYRAYLLRCWEERGQESDGRISWRFSLEEVGGEHRLHGFGDLKALTSFLQAELMGRPPDESGREE